MGLLDFLKMSKGDKPIITEFKWNPGEKIKLMSYNEVIKCLKSGSPERMADAIGRQILNAPKLYNDVSTSLKSTTKETLIEILIPLLKHESYEVRCCIPSVLEVIGDYSVIPFLEDVVKNDGDSQVVKNARLAIMKIKSYDVNTDSVKFIRRYTKLIDGATGTYEEYSAPNKIVAMAFLDKTKIVEDLFYIDIITPDGNMGKDKMGKF